jgi:hypothetical protein
MLCSASKWDVSRPLTISLQFEHLTVVLRSKEKLNSELPRSLRLPLTVKEPRKPIGSKPNNTKSTTPKQKKQKFIAPPSTFELTPNNSNEEERNAFHLGNSNNEQQQQSYVHSTCFSNFH